MRDGVTLKQRLSLDGRKRRVSPVNASANDTISYFAFLSAFIKTLMRHIKTIIVIVKFAGF